MGDAAHVHSPAGGQGMNTGLVDAVVLGEILIEVLQGRQPVEFLDVYENLRRPAAKQVLALAGRLTSLATMKDGPQRLLRNAGLGLLNLIPPAKSRLTLALSGLDRAKAAALPGRFSRR